MALDCDNSGLSFETLLMMSMRVSGDKNVLDISEAVVADVCEPYILCGGETILTALKKLFVQKGVNCWSVRGVYTAGGCNPYFTCDNSGESILTALAKSLTVDATGNPVMKFATTTQDADIDCDTIINESLFKGLFEIDGNDCVHIRVVSATIDEDCNTFSCDHGQLTTLLANAIGYGGVNCPAFFTGSSDNVPPLCNLPLIEAAISLCQSGDAYMWLLSSDGNNTQWGAGTTVEYYYKVDVGDPWIQFSLTFTGNRSDVLPVGAQYFRAVVTCDGDEVEFILSRLVSDDSYFGYYINYQIDSGSLAPLIATNTYYVAEDETITLWSLDNEAVGRWELINPLRLLANNTASVTIDFSDAELDANGEYLCTLNVDIIDLVSLGCSAFAVGLIQFVPNPVITGGTAICLGSPTTLTANFGTNVVMVYDSYQWYKDGAIIGGATNQTYDATTAGTYTCIGTFGGVSTTSLPNVMVNSPLPVPSINPDLAYFDKGYIYNPSSNTYYCPSDTVTMWLLVTDLDLYTGGWPIGTTVSIPIITGGSPEDIFIFNDGLGANNPAAQFLSGVVATVTLPVGLGGCSGDSEELSINNGLIAPQTIYECSPGVADLPIVVVTPTGGGNYDLSTTGIGTCSHDYTAGAAWVKLYDLATDTLTPIDGGTGRPLADIDTGLTTTVNGSGVYGFYADDIIFGSVIVIIP